MIEDTTKLDKKNTSRMLVVDLLSYSLSHVSINSFWVMELLRRRRFCVVAETEHLKALSDATRSDFPFRAVRKGRFWKVLRELYFFRALVTEADGPKFIMGATGLQVALLAIMERVFPSRAQRWSVVLHSEIEGVVGAQGLMRSFAGFAFRSLGFPKTVRCIVLGQHIKNNLRKLNLDSERIRAIEHPLPSATVKPFSRADSANLRLAVVGLLRGDTKDLSVAGEVSRQTGVSVSLIGRIGPEYKRPSGVKEELSSTHYSMEWMEDRLDKIDALLLCPAAEKYRFTALGTITDAITYGKCAAWIKHEALSAYERAPFTVCASTPRELADRITSFQPPSVAQVETWIAAWNETASVSINELWDQISGEN